MRNYIFAAMAGLTLLAAADGGVDTYTATGWTPSSAARFCVIAARVARVTVGDMGEDKPHVLELHPQATLAGKFDPSLRPSLTVRCYTAPNSSIRSLPPEGSMVLAAVRLRDVADPSDFDMAVSAYCTYMPQESALIEIKGMDDPVYLETLQRIQKERAFAIARAATSPTTQMAP
jgi:hypothetical protein